MEKIKINTDDGISVEASAPIIVSASRATDIPAFMQTGSRKGCIKDTQFGKPFQWGKILCGIR